MNFAFVYIYRHIYRKWVSLVDSKCRNTVADPVKSGNIFTDMYWRESVKDERDATKTSRMGLGTIRTLTDELQVRYGRGTDTLFR